MVSTCSCEIMVQKSANVRAMGAWVAMALEVIKKLIDKKKILLRCQLCLYSYLGACSVRSRMWEALM